MHDIPAPDRIIFGPGSSQNLQEVLISLEQWGRGILQRISELPSTDMLRDSGQNIDELNADLMDKNAVLRNLAITDELTGLHNRFYFDQRIHEEIERADRYGNPLTLIMFDLDHFKNVNDIWGHDTGDKVLVAVAAAVRERIRKPDIFARWGGEEFLIAPLQTDLQGAARLAEKLRQALADLQHPDVGQVTASFGLACRMPDESYESWFRRTDQALYQAKSQGRNCVLVGDTADELPSAQIRLDWNPVWECGNRVIDTQHKHIMVQANRLIELSINSSNPEEIEPQLQHLVSEITHHFSDEEMIMNQIKFPDTGQHAERHKNLIVKLKRLREGYLRGRLKTSAFFVFVVDEVIVGHILVDDVLYFPYIRDLSEKT
jgi:diguanylate cyclase (GGDEF)-like protein/hemerythrin-like metal-binding protein